VAGHLDHHCYLAYAFPHALSDAELATKPVLTGSPWRHWFARLRDSPQRVEVLADHSFSFLPHVRRLLYPELAGAALPEITAALATTAGNDVGAVRRALCPRKDRYDQRFAHASVRLTWYGDLLRPDSRLRLCLPVSGGTEEEFQLTVRWVDAVLFPEGVGVLIVALEVPEDVDTATMARLIRFLKKIEYRRRLSVELARIRFGAAGPDETTTTWTELLRVLLADLSFGPPPDSRVAASDVAATLGVNWRVAAVSHVLDVHPDDVCPPFTTVADQACFALATGRMVSRTATADIPSAVQWGYLSGRRRLSLWNDWQMLYHYDNLIQAVTSTDPAYARHQYENFEYEYLTLFILATAQRHVLDLMESELAQISGRLSDASRELERFTAKLIRFNTRLRLLDVSTTPVGAPLYELLRMEFGLPRSFTTLRTGTAALETYLSARHARRQEISSMRTERFIELLTVVGAPLGLYAALAQSQLQNLTWLKNITPADAWWIMLALVSLLILIWLGIRRSNKAKHDEL
jgi:hypothetical protein